MELSKENTTSTVIMPNLSEGDNALTILTDAIIFASQGIPLKDMSGQPVIGLVIAYGSIGDGFTLTAKCCKSFDCVVVPVSKGIFDAAISTPSPKIIIAIEPLKAQIFDLTQLISFDSKANSMFITLDEEELFAVIIETIAKSLKIGV